MDALEERSDNEDQRRIIKNIYGEIDCIVAVFAINIVEVFAMPTVIPLWICGRL